MAAERKKLSSESLFPPKKVKKRIDMSNSNNNQINVPQACEAGDLGSARWSRRRIPYEVQDLIG
jgi:hypothetical protein